MSKNAPAPPDYQAAAAEQAAGSLAVTEAQTLANRPNQYTPWGSSEWTQGPGGQWTQNLTLDPQQQEALDAQMGVQVSRSNLANDLTGRMEDEFGTPMDWSQFGEMGGIPGVTQAEQLQRGLDTEGLQNVDSSQRYMQSAGDALYGRATSRLDPQWEQRAQATEIKLRNQGLRPGDEAYDTAMTNMEMDRTDAYQQAGYGADIGAGAEASRMFGMDFGLRGQQFGELGMQGTFANQAAGQAFGMGATQFGQGMDASNLQTQQRQQQIIEEMQQRGFSLNEMNAIMTGQQVGMPQMPGFTNASRAEGVQSLDAANMGWNASLDQFGANQAGVQGLMAGAGAIASNWPSDRRLKTDIEFVGMLKGNKWYSYKLFGLFPTLGVMSDEINPDAVIRHPSGYDMVNYGRL